MTPIRRPTSSNRMEKWLGFDCFIACPNDTDSKPCLRPSATMSWTLRAWDMPENTRFRPRHGDCIVHAFRILSIPAHFFQCSACSHHALSGALRLIVEAPDGPVHWFIVIRHDRVNYSGICWCSIYRERLDNGRGEAVDCTRVTRELVRLIKQDEARLRVIAYTHAQSVCFELWANGVSLDFAVRGQLRSMRLV